MASKQDIDTLLEQLYKTASQNDETRSDWPREKAMAILSHVREAMEPGVSQLLIDEIVLPNSGAHWQATTMDMRMMMAAGARERTVGEWTELLDDAGLRVVGIHTYLPRHQNSIIQAVAN